VSDTTSKNIINGKNQSGRRVTDGSDPEHDNSPRLHVLNYLIQILSFIVYYLCYEIWFWNNLLYIICGICYYVLYIIRYIVL
jgi:hypothetical protein